MRGLGTAFVVLMWLTTVADVVTGGWAWHFADVMAGHSLEEAAGDEEIATLGLNALLGLVRTLLFFATGVVFVVWSWRVRSNSDLARPGAHRYHQQWVIWGWLPIVNFWIPRRLVLDSWSAAKPASSPAKQTEVDVWWALFLGYLIADRVASRLFLRAGTQADLAASAWALDAVALLSVGAAAFATIVVRRVGDWQSTPGFVPPHDVPLPPPPMSFGPVEPARPNVVNAPTEDPRWSRPTD
ncbi:DUF4328 domain-containing protein [Actinosynnema sp. NPDC020468]|uniref:DUF4328 domain-containing protein n=1 Tax=Actinosynnema sp. NPDC020468 TaxID=3154488 RepID=UPI0033E55DF0